MNDNRNNRYDDEDQDVWQMPSVDAIPLLVERHGISEREAYAIWYEHQDHSRIVDDVEIIQDEQQAEEIERQRAAPEVVTRKLFSKSAQKKSFDAE